jgi:hypothetical protein
VNTTMSIAQMRLRVVAVVAFASSMLVSGEG